MNKDQVKGKAKDIAGKVQEKAGKLVGSEEQRAKGLSKQISGKAQERFGDVKQAVEDLDPGFTEFYTLNRICEVQLPRSVPKLQVTGIDKVMAITENSLDPFPGIYAYVNRIYAACEAEDLVNAVSEYLASWSKQKIENLQKVDGGWGPFDKYGQPTGLRTVGDVTRIGDVVRRQLVALEEFGIEPTSELVELDLFLFIAGEVAEDRVAIASRKYSGVPRWREDQQREESGTSNRRS